MYAGDNIAILLCPDAAVHACMPTRLCLVSETKTTRDAPTYILPYIRRASKQKHLAYCILSLLTYGGRMWR